MPVGVRLISLNTRGILIFKSEEWYLLGVGEKEQV